MSDLWGITYDYPVSPNLSNTTDDVQGPYCAVICTGAGTAQVYPLNGPLGNLNTPIPIPMVAGQVLPFPIRRLSASSTGTYIAYVGSIIRQGPK